MSVPKCLFFQDLEGLTEVFGRMSAGISGEKLPLWAEFSFLSKGQVWANITGNKSIRSGRAYLLSILPKSQSRNGIEKRRTRESKRGEGARWGEKPSEPTSCKPGHGESQCPRSCPTQASGWATGETRHADLAQLVFVWGGGQSMCFGALKWGCLASISHLLYKPCPQLAVPERERERSTSPEPDIPWK